MQKWLLVGLVAVNSLCAIDLEYTYTSEHIEIACTKADREICADLLVEIEKVYAQLAQDFQHQFAEKIHVQVFPGIRSFHRSIAKEDAPDWLVCNLELPIQVVSPLNPGSYHSSDNVKKALMRGIVNAFIKDVFKQSSAPWWLLTGVSAKKAGWPYVRQETMLPKMAELENATYGAPGMGWCALSLTSFIEQMYGWETILKLLEDYASFEKILGLSKEELILQWQASFS